MNPFSLRLLVGITLIAILATATAADSTAGELEQAIEMMRQQGMSEEQIEQFRRMMGGVVAEGERQQATRNSAAQAEFDARHSDAPRVLVTLGTNRYELPRTACVNEDGKFEVRAAAGTSKRDAQFSITRSRMAAGHISWLHFEVGDARIEIERPDWNYDGSAFRFDAEVRVDTWRGNEVSRDTRRLTVEAPC